MNEEIKRRFFAKVKADPVTGCHLWTAFRAPFGYGLFTMEGRNRPAPQAAWIIAHGPIPEGLWVLHHCDNPPCVNPDHLYLGTAKDNARDMWARGRHAPIARPVKLNADQVRIIRAFPKKASVQRELGLEFGVSAFHIWEIQVGRGWGDVS